MPNQASDEKKTSAPTLTTVETPPPAHQIVEDEVCRVFISRKTTDKDILGAATEDRDKLVSLVGAASDGETDRLQFFDAELIPLGVDWRREIRAEIQRADILLLVLTRPAQDHFDWPLYEAGLFDSLREDGRLVCFYPEGGEPPAQVKDIQGVKASKKNILKFLERLFTDKEFTNTRTPLLKPKTFNTFSDLMNEIATRIYSRINGGSDPLPEVTYANPYIQLILEPGMSTLVKAIEIESDKDSLRALFKDIEIESDKDSLRRLFKLTMQPPPGDQSSRRERWTWGDLEKAVDLGDKDRGNFNSAWMREAEIAIGKLLQGRAEDSQIRSRFITKDKDERIWGPEIEIWRTYNSKKIIVDITFSPDVQAVWLKNAKPPVALAANLSLAVRIRHDLIETYLRRLPHWRDDDASHFSDLEEHIQSIEREGFIIRWITQDSYAEAFELDDADKLADLEKDFGIKIHSQLQEAVENRKVKEATAALKLWRDNNAEFLSIGIPQYTKLLRLET